MFVRCPNKAHHVQLLCDESEVEADLELPSHLSFTFPSTYVNVQPQPILAKSEAVRNTRRRQPPQRLTYTQGFVQVP